MMLDLLLRYWLYFFVFQIEKFPVSSGIRVGILYTPHHFYRNCCVIEEIGVHFTQKTADPGFE